MKKNILFILLVFFLIFVSCENSTEGRIKKEFKKYVSLNFDDPNSFKKLLSIEPNDTASLSSVLEVTKFGLEVGQSTNNWCDSIGDINSEMINEIANEIKRNSRSYVQSLRAAELVKEIYADLNEELELVKSNMIIKNKIEQAIKDSQYEAPIYEYSIKFREQYNDKLRLAEHFAYIDSSTTEITIKPNKLQVNEISSQITYLLKLNDEYSSNIKSRIQNIKRHSEAIKELKSLL